LQALVHLCRQLHAAAAAARLATGAAPIRVHCNIRPAYTVLLPLLMLLAFLFLPAPLLLLLLLMRVTAGSRRRLRSLLLDAVSHRLCQVLGSKSCSRRSDGHQLLQFCGQLLYLPSLSSMGSDAFAWL
jgi:hypothetical protein